MKPGIELDALIAEKVMGWKKLHLNPPWLGAFHKIEWYWDRKEGCFANEVQECPRYSTDMNTVWEVVKELTWKNKRNFQLDYSQFMIWYCGFEIDGKIDILSCSDAAIGGSASHAICLAALRAVGNPVGVLISEIRN